MSHGGQWGQIRHSTLRKPDLVVPKGPLMDFSSFLLLLRSAMAPAASAHPLHTKPPEKGHPARSAATWVFIHCHHRTC